MSFDRSEEDNSIKVHRTNQNCLSVDMLRYIIKVIEFEGKVCFKSP